MFIITNLRTDDLNTEYSKTKTPPTIHDTPDIWLTLSEGHASVMQHHVELWNICV
jgi:hypothetical protein